MKILLGFIIVLGLLVGGGYYGYGKIKSYAANKMVDEVASHLSANEIANLKKDPQVEEMLKNAGNSSNPVITKQQAVQMLEKKFTASEIKDFAMMARGGFSAQEKTKIKNELESRLTPKQLKELEAAALQQLGQK